MKIYDVIPSTRIPISRNQFFSYGSEKPLLPGDLVEIEFGKKTLRGIVWKEQSNSPKSLKNIQRRLYRSYLSKAQRELLFDMHKYYNAPLGLLLKLFLTGFNEKIPASVETVKTSLPLTLQLTDEQQEAVSRIHSSIAKNNSQQFLLHGITGSGKTEVYIRSVKYVFEKSHQSLILTPEIAISPQIAERFKGAFGDNVLIYHSKMTPKQRRDVVAAALYNPRAIIIGPRSALFLPYRKLGIIVIDEEHDSSFKQYDQKPHYDARLVASLYAKKLHIPLVFGDATPRIELYHRAKLGNVEYIGLTKRISESSNDIPLPKVSIIDYLSELKVKNPGPLSRKLVSSIRTALSEKEQVFLFLNRRGFATSILCISCQNVIECSQCSTPLAVHGNQLICHQCGARSSSQPRFCPKCQSPQLKQHGIGTEKVELAVRKLFPEARIGRIDSDSMSTAKKYLEFYRAIHDHKLDIVIGTQMIAQGFDIPRVQLVGVVQIDNALNLPDFRAEEQVFQMLTQVAGRAGRREKQGNMLIQTFFPEHEVFKAVKNHDYEEFYQREIAERKKFQNPPFSFLVRLTYENKDEQAAEKEAEMLAGTLTKKKVEVLGPSPAFCYKKRNMYRWNILLKLKNHTEVPFDSIPDTWDIDVNPLTLD